VLPKSIDKLFSAALAIDDQGAVDAGELGFMARAMTLCTMPHSKPRGEVFKRQNGDYTLSMWSPNGLPYGSVPRLLLAWISTEAVRTKQRTLVLGDSLSHFMRQLDMPINGGVKGGITRLREQMRRLFACSISCNYHTKDRDAGMGFRIAQKYDLWWHPQEPDQAGLWESTLTLSEEFFEEIAKSPVPIDMRSLKALKRSPLALDLYIWLTFRTSYLKSSTIITWEQLQGQFGSEYKRTIDFKIAFNDALRKVQLVYSGANISTADAGIILVPGTTSVSKKSGGKLS